MTGKAHEGGEKKTARERRERFETSSGFEIKGGYGPDDLPDFDPARVARFDGRRIERLLRDPAIVRNRLKVESAVNNARRVLAVAKAIREAGILTSPPNEIPFLSSLFQK